MHPALAPHAPLEESFSSSPPFANARARRIVERQPWSATWSRSAPEGRLPDPTAISANPTQAPPSDPHHAQKATRPPANARHRRNIFRANSNSYS